MAAGSAIEHIALSNYIGSETMECSYPSSLAMGSTSSHWASRRVRVWRSGTMARFSSSQRVYLLGCPGSSADSNASSDRPLLGHRCCTYHQNRGGPSEP